MKSEWNQDEIYIMILRQNMDKIWILSKILKNLDKIYPTLSRFFQIFSRIRIKSGLYFDKNGVFKKSGENLDKRELTALWLTKVFNLETYFWYFDKIIWFLIFRLHIWSTYIQKVKEFIDVPTVHQSLKWLSPLTK